MQFNWTAVIISTLIPMVMGFVWYNPKTMGKMWMEANGFKEEEMKENFNPVKVFGLAFIMSFLISLALHPMVIHQWGFMSSLMTGDKGTIPAELTQYVADYMAKYGTNFRSYGHGALHGLIISIFLVLPIIVTNALFEKRSGKYIFVHWGYWSICLTLMGAVICGMM